MLKSLFFLIIGFVQFFAYNADNNNSIIKGSFDGAWDIDFSIYTYNSEGVVLYISDLKSRLLLRLAGQDLIAAFNSHRKKILLKDICGCNICFNVMIHFLLNKTKFVKVRTKCMNIHKEFFINETWSSENWKKFSLSNKNNNPIMSMGNVPYVDQGNEIPFFKENLKGCLIDFTFNRKSLEYKAVTKYFDNKCYDCHPSICNDDICVKNSNGIKCECSNNTTNKSCNYGEKNTAKAQKGFVGFFMSNVTISMLGLIFLATIIFFTTMILIMLNILVKLRKKQVNPSVEYSSVQFNMDLELNTERNTDDNSVNYDRLDYNNVTDMDYITPNHSIFRNIFENQFSVDPPPLPPRN